MGRLLDGLLDRALDHPPRVQERVVHGHAVAHVEPGRGLQVGMGGAGQVGDERRHEPSAGRPQVGHRGGDVAPALPLQEEEKAQASRAVQAQDVARPVVLALLLVEDLEDALPDLFVGVHSVLVLDAGEGGGVEDEEADVAALGELLLDLRKPLVIGRNGLGHLDDAAEGASVGWILAQCGCRRKAEGGAHC